MRTSLNEIQQIEKFLTGELPPDEHLLFEAQMLTNPQLKLHVALQKEIYLLLAHYHRNKLKHEVKEIHDRLFSKRKYNAFQKAIFSLFKL